MTVNETKTTKEFPIHENATFQTEKKIHKAVNVSLWISIPSVMLILILWILHNWLGYWLVYCVHEYTIADKPSRWALSNLPLWLVGKGILRNRWSYPFPIHKRNAPKYICQFLNHDQEVLKQRAWQWIDSISRHWPENIKNIKYFYFQITIAIYDSDPDIRFWAFSSLWHYWIDNEEDLNFALKNLKEVIALEKDIQVKDGLQRIIKHVSTISVNSLFLYQKKKANKSIHATGQNIQLFIEVLREYHAKKK